MTTTPNRYISQLYGINFDLWPNSVIGWRSTDNANPLEKVGMAGQYNRFYVISRSNTYIEFGYLEDHYSVQQMYLGCITDMALNILWRNDSKPLPN